QDKLEKGAKKYGSSVEAIARKFEDYFYRSMDLMGNKRPDVICRATEHIDEMLALVKKLEKKGYTYEIEGDGIYFDTSKINDYGELAGVDLAGLQEGARVKKVEGKRNPTDFALWKFEREGENRAMSWASPWAGKSFPGWHVECSAMSIKYLGPQLDIHTGGIDHIQVHHPNEIAQSEYATGKKPFVKYWVHHNHLMVEGEKMSKSLDNFFTIDDILERGYEPMALRLLFLGAHYRSQQNFTWDSLAASQKSWNKLKLKLAELNQQVLKENTNFDWEKHELTAQAQQFSSKFFEAINNDLNTPEAVAVMWQVVSADLSAADKLSLLLKFDQVLGLGFAIQKDIDVFSVPEEIEKLLVERKKARENQDWEKSDQIRQQVEEAGFKLMDTESGQMVRKKVNQL
ncbi:MAG: cysteine--tRNA ligase, partial [Patescibacteria group bacterium]|nr:cysteine--tRNA ligase [Patescibacteria group bacterium]